MAITSTACCKLAFEFLALVRLAVVSYVHASANYAKRHTLKIEEDFKLIEGIQCSTWSCQNVFLAYIVHRV